MSDYSQAQCDWAAASNTAALIMRMIPAANITIQGERERVEGCQVSQLFPSTFSLLHCLVYTLSPPVGDLPVQPACFIICPAQWKAGPVKNHLCRHLHYVIYRHR